MKDEWKQDRSSFCLHPSAFLVALPGSRRAGSRPSRCRSVDLIVGGGLLQFSRITLVLANSWHVLCSVIVREASPLFLLDKEVRHVSDRLLG